MTEGSYIMDRIRHKCVEEGDCLIWQGDKSMDGRPRFFVDGKRVYLRHALWVEKFGREPDEGKRVGVSCRRECCIAEEHLIARTRSQELKGRMRSPDHKIRIALARRRNSKYSDELVAMIRLSDKPTMELAKDLGMHYQTVYRFRNGELRKNVAANPFAGLMA